MSKTKSQLFNVLAVLADQKPIHRVNVRRMSKELTDKKGGQPSQGRRHPRLCHPGIE